MGAVVHVPQAVEDEVAALGLPPGLWLDALEELDGYVEPGHRQTLLRLAGPAPTFVCRVALMDPTIPMRRHLFTFYLEEWGDEDSLAVVQVEHSSRENWWSDPDDGGPGSPEDDD